MIDPTEYVKLINILESKLARPIYSLFVRARTGLSVPDKQILDFLYPCFDRPAFRDPLYVEVGPDFLQALADTLYALQTGIRRTRDGETLGRGKPISELKDANLQRDFREIVDTLSSLIKVFRLALENGGCELCGVFLIINDDRVPEIVDVGRLRIINAVNEIYSRLGKSPLPAVSESHYFSSGGKPRRSQPIHTESGYWERVRNFVNHHLNVE